MTVDGTKIRAVNSKDTCYNEAVLKKKIANIEEKTEKYLLILEESDSHEQNDIELPGEKITEAIEELNERKVKYEALPDEMIQSGESQILTTDPDCIGSPDMELQKIPDDARISPANHTLCTSKVPDKKVFLRIPEEKEKLKQRKCLMTRAINMIGIKKIIAAI